MLEIVVASHVFRRHHKGVDVGAGTEYTQTKATICEDLAPGVFYENIVLGFFFTSDTLDKLVAYLL